MDTSFKVKCFREIEENINKRYVLIFNIWADRKVTKTISQFDDFEDVKEEYMLIDEMYNDTPKPTKLPKEKHSTSRIINLDFSDGKKFWGYIVIDYEKNEIIRIHNDGLQKFGRKINESMKDYYLREPGEIPEDFKFSCQAEYDGWLQYRWGNRMNAVDYVAPPKPKKKPKTEIGYDFETCGLGGFPTPDDYDNEILENKFADMIDKETQKRLMDKYGW